MERGSHIEAEKANKIKKASEMETYENEDFVDEEAMESFGERSDIQPPTFVSCVPSTTRTSSSEENKSEPGSMTSETADSFRTWREKQMRMKWSTVTGKKPLNIPFFRLYDNGREQQSSKFVVPLFGERRPLEVEKLRKENWMKIRMRKGVVWRYIDGGRVLQEIRLLESYNGLRCLRFSPDGRNMITTFGNGIVQIRETDTGDVTLTLQTIENLYRLEVMTARYHPRNQTRVYIGGACGFVQVFDTYHPKPIGTIREKGNEICNLDLSPDGSVLVSVGKDGKIYIYDAYKLKLVSLQSEPSFDDLSDNRDQLYHRMRIFGLKYHPTDPNIFVTGGWDYTVKVWDTRVCGAVNSIFGPRICGDAIDVRGNEILTGSWSVSNSIKIWDLSSGKVLRNISAVNRFSPVDGEFVYVVKFLSSSQHTNCIVAGGNGIDEIHVINIDKNMLIASFPGMKAVTALDSYDDVVAYGGMESLLRIGDLRNPLVAQSSSNIQVF